MKRPRKEGILRVVQVTSPMLPTEACIRDFDASEWSHGWTKRGAVDILRVMHDNTDDDADTFEFVEFSAPVQIEFIAQH